MIRTWETDVLAQKPSPVTLYSPHPKQTGMGSNASLRVGLRKSRGISYVFGHLYQSSARCRYHLVRSDGSKEPWPNLRHCSN
jgi:hypothetical protein